MKDRKFRVQSSLFRSLWLRVRPSTQLCCTEEEEVSLESVRRRRRFRCSVGRPVASSFRHGSLWYALVWASRATQVVTCSGIVVGKIICLSSFEEEKVGNKLWPLKALLLYMVSLGQDAAMQLVIL
jgi:hypothetical protein